MSHCRLRSTFVGIAIAYLVGWGANPIAAAVGDQLFKFVASDASAGDQFGYSVATSGNTALIGALLDDGQRGSAYLFDVGTGQQLQKLTASDPTAGAIFGSAVCISGNRAIVSAYGASSFAGSAYVFDISTGQQLFKLTAADAATSDRFGISVAISGDKAIVGADFDDFKGFTNAGSAYIFDVTTGQQLFKLTASDAAGSDFFGHSVGISGNTAIVGSFGAGAGDPGAAYLFDVTTGQQLAKLVASDVAPQDRFGVTVGIDGNVAIVGAVADDNANGVDAGAAYLFDVTTRSQLHKLTASDGSSNDTFGSSVSISGNMAIVGAFQDDHTAGTDPGSAYLFEVATGQQVRKLVASDAEANDYFGFAVSISDTAAVVGAFQDDHTSGVNAGSAYLFQSVPEPSALLLAVWGVLELLLAHRRSWRCR